jgi:hypothetical protein
MSPSEYRPARVFTLDQANATLPLVRAIAGDLVELSRDVIERRQRLDLLSSGRDFEAGDPYDDELAHIEKELEKDAVKLQEFVSELRQLGVEPKSGPEGLVDFPALMDGRLVYLCWRYGEPEILYWHELDSGFAGRQSLTAGVADDGGSSHGDGSAEL